MHITIQGWSARHVVNEAKLTSVIKIFGWETKCVESKRRPTGGYLHLLKCTTTTYVARATTEGFAAKKVNACHSLEGRSPDDPDSDRGIAS